MADLFKRTAEGQADDSLSCVPKHNFCVTGPSVLIACPQIIC